MGDAALGRKIRVAFPKLKSPYFQEFIKALRKLLQLSDLSQPRKLLYWVLVEGTVLNPRKKRVDLLLEEIHSEWNWAPWTGDLNNLLTTQNNSECVASCRVVIKSRSGRRLKETAEQDYHREPIHPFWDYVGEVTVRINPK